MPENTFNKSSEFAAAFEAGQKTVCMFKPGEGEIPFMIVPNGMNQINLENTLPKPVRTRKNTAFADVASFIEYVNTFKGPDTRIYSHRGANSAGMYAVLDHFSKEYPAWGEHIARYACPPSVEWKRWVENDKRSLEQEAFADFIELNSEDMVEPSGAVMLEMALTLAMKKDVAYYSQTRMQNGAMKFTYNEDIDTRAGATGEMILPDKIILGLAPFEDGKRYKVTARFRYRLNSNRKVVFNYELIRIDKVVEDAFKEVTQAVEEKTGIKVWAEYKG